MDDYAGRVLADRYRLPLPPSDAYELAETRAFDTYSGQEVLVRQVPLPEIVEAEVVDMEGPLGSAVPGRTQGRSTRRPADPAVRRAMDAARAAAQIPDHPRLDQVFDVFAEDGSLWIVSERVAARPLAALLAEKPLTPYRAAEVASDVLTALRVLHAHGWTHRNITTRTVLVCDDGRVVLTGLASGAAEEALCGYAPVPAPVDPDHDHDHDHDHEDGDGDGDGDGDFDDRDLHDGELAEGEFGPDGYEGHEDHPHGEGLGDEDYSYGEAGEGSPEPAVLESPHSADPYATPDPYLAPDLYPYRPPAHGTGTGVGPGPAAPGPTAPGSAAPGPTGTGVPDIRAARAGAIAAYRAGARAAARVSEDLRQGDRPVQTGNDPDWWAAKPGERHIAPAEYRADDDADADRADDAADEDEFGDDYGAGGPGRPRLAGTWHDGPLPGQDGPAPQSAGGGGPARHPQRDNDPYGVDPYGVRQALPGGSHRPDPGTGRGTGRGGSGDPYRDRPALPAPRSGTPDPYRHVDGQHSPATHPRPLQPPMHSAIWCIPGP
ncbi:protein kinase, partial [Streptomyces sp. NPDC051098]|uniref:protein kinase n=1 Tax=Streptomyces sp. NPDC051098 TaxID=3155411 RepID=UPI00342DD393